MACVSKQLSNICSPLIRWVRFDSFHSGELEHHSRRVKFSWSLNHRKTLHVVRFWNKIKHLSCFSIRKFKSFAKINCWLNVKPVFKDGIFISALTSNFTQPLMYLYLLLTSEISQKFSDTKCKLINTRLNTSYLLNDSNLTIVKAGFIWNWYNRKEIYISSYQPRVPPPGFCYVLSSCSLNWKTWCPQSSR